MEHQKFTILLDCRQLVHNRGRWYKHQLSPLFCLVMLLWRLQKLAACSWRALDCFDWGLTVLVGSSSFRFCPCCLCDLLVCVLVDGSVFDAEEIVVSTLETWGPSMKWWCNVSAAESSWHGGESECHDIDFFLLRHLHRRYPALLFMVAVSCVTFI